MTLKIMPHGRLQERIAAEAGYFVAEGLDYVFVPEGDYGIHVDQREPSGQVRTGAYETFGAGRDGADISCACHWATNEAAVHGAGRLVTAAYSVTPAAVMVAPESPVRRPEDLAGVEIGVGYHSGSHFATLQALEAVLPADRINLSFSGPPNERLDALLERRLPAATAWGVPLYIAEALGFRKVLDATFMIGFLATGAGAGVEGGSDGGVEGGSGAGVADGSDGGTSDIAKYLRALRRAQADLDLHPERYKHHHLASVPEKYRDLVDVRTFGTGERIVFLPYTAEARAETHHFVEEREVVVG